MSVIFSLKSTYVLLLCHVKLFFPPFSATLWDKPDLLFQSVFLVAMITISWHHSPFASIFIAEFLHSQICVLMFDEAFVILQELSLLKTFQSCFIFSYSSLA